MKLTIPVEFSQEVTVQIGIEDIAQALAEACALEEEPDTVNALAEILRAINTTYQFFKALPDAVIARMTATQRATIYAGLLPQIHRFQEVPDDHTPPILQLEACFAAIQTRHQAAGIFHQRVAQHRSLWTHTEALDCLRLWVQAYGVLPAPADCQAEYWLPARSAILRLFGSYPAYLDYGHPFLPPKPLLSPVVYLVCGRSWASPDRRQFRVCPRCTKHAWENEDCSGDWLNGTCLVEETTVEVDDLMGIPQVPTTRPQRRAG